MSQPPSTTSPSAGGAVRPGLMRQIQELDNRFWIVNVMEMFERLAYYGVRAVIAIYMVLAVELGGPEFTHVQKGSIFAAWAAMQSVLPMFTGGFADRYGHKRTIVVAILFKIAGYVMMAHFKDYGLFFTGCMLLAGGTAIFKPGVQGTLAATLKASNASVGWGIFYQLVNVGGFLGPVLAGSLRILDWQYVFYACALIVSINFLWLPFYTDPTEEGAVDLVAHEAKQKAGWAAISRAVPVSVSRGWGVAFALLTAAWFAALFGGAGLAGTLVGVDSLETTVGAWISGAFLPIAALGTLAGLAAAALAWNPATAKRAAALMAVLLVAVLALSATGTVDDAQVILDASRAEPGGLPRVAFILRYLAYTGVIIAPALMVFTGDKAAFDAGRTDAFGVYVASVSGLFQHRVFFFCLVFSGFWLMFNQVFDLLPNVIDDWVDSSGILLALGGAFSTPAVPTVLAVLAAGIVGGVCAASVLLAMRPDHRPARDVPVPAYAVVALALTGAAWAALGALAPASWGSVGPAVGAPLVGIAAAGLAFARRIPARALAIGAAVVGGIGALVQVRAVLLASAAELVELARTGGQVPPEWMINLNPALITFTMVGFAYLSGFVRPLTSIILGMAVATVGGIVAGTAVTGAICLAGILVFSVGEMLSSPKKMEYLATLSPKGGEGLFMGYANIPVAIGWIAGSIFAGNAYEERGDKVNLAKQYLSERLGMAPEAVDALQKTDVMPTLAAKLDVSVIEAQRVLFDTYHPEAIWMDIGLIGLVSIVGMVVYDRVVRRVDARRELSSAA